MVTITIEMLLARLRQDPLAALDLTSIACEHLAEAHDRLRSLSVDPALHRLARTLIGLAADFGEPAPDGVLVLRYITQQELAHLVGARREVVSGLLNRLRDRGLIRYLRRGPISIEGKALRAFVESGDTAEAPDVSSVTYGRSDQPYVGRWSRCGIRGGRPVGDAQRLQETTR